MSLFDGRLDDEVRPGDRFNTGRRLGRSATAQGLTDQFAALRQTDLVLIEQPTERIPVVRLPTGPTPAGRHSRPSDGSGATARPRARRPMPFATATQPATRHVLPRRRRRSLGWRIAKTAVSFTLVLILSAAALAAYAYQKFNSQIHRVAVLQIHDANIRNPARQQNAENFLVIGSDTRAGADARFGNVAGARSDTTILVHLSPDRAKVTVISIPRDSWVDIPRCTASDGNPIAAHQEMFNSAFAIGGPACTIATVQKLTGIAVTHFLEVDFSGFESMVTAMGSVTICSPQSVFDPYSGLKLHPGQNHLNGEQALAFVRARETLGDGSDLGRIKRQQIFLGAVLRQATSGSMLSNPAQLTSFLNAATKAITVDKGTSFSDLRTLATSMQGLDPRRVTFYTAPIANQNYTPPGTTMTGRVLLDSVDGRVLYDSVINDTKPVLVRRVGGKPQVVGSSPTPAAGSAHPGKPSPSTAPIPVASLNAAQQSCAL